MAEPMLALASVEVRYGAVPAVRGVSFGVAKGEIVGLIGPNGAGKSTTLHAITGLVPTHRGQIRVEGESILGRPPERIAQSGVSLVPEGRRIYADFTVEENLRLGLAARRGRGGLAEAYELFPMLEEFRRRSAGALSGGQQQQLAIARALVGKAAAPASRRAVARPRAHPRGRSLRDAHAHPGAGRDDPPRRAAGAANRRARRSDVRAGKRRAADDARSERTQRTRTSWWRPTSPDDRRRPRRPDARRRDRPRRRLRVDGGRHRARLRRPAARQLRVRPARHGGRVHAGLHGVLADRGEHRCVLRRRRRAVDAHGAGRLPPAARRVPGGDARDHVRDRVRAAGGCAARGHSRRHDRRDRHLDRVVQPAGHGRRSRDSQDHDRLGGDRRGRPRDCWHCC